MPLYEYLCQKCGQVSEILVSAPSNQPRCQACGGANLKKLLSAHASPSVGSKNRLPGPGDTACCGSVPGQAAGCAGPGSCCGKH
jgi:putative FmdB family regulatory protein